MLSKTELEYLKDIEAFEDAHGFAYAKVVRSRIRKRVEQAFEDLSLIIEMDDSGRRPAENFRTRTAKNLEGLEYNRVVTSQGINAFKRRSGGNKEKRILDPEDDLLVQFLYKLATYNSLYVGIYKNAVDSAIKRAAKKAMDYSRNRLLNTYCSRLKNLDDEQLRQALSDDYTLMFGCGFSNVEECIVWLKSQA